MAEPEGQPSGDTPKLSGPRPMRLVEQLQRPDPTQTTPPTPTQTTPPDLAREALTRAAWRSGVLGALNLAARVLAVRMILLLAVLGAVFLARVTLADPQNQQIAVLGIYCALVVMPLIWLGSRGG